MPTATTSMCSTMPSTSTALPPPCGGGCGCGGRKKREISDCDLGGGCYRKKRQAVIPQLSTEQDRPCPQVEWLPLIEKNLGTDAPSSARAIQGALFKKYEHKFIVSCHQKKDAAGLSLVAHGDGYCAASNEVVWCQAIALAA
ncbi:hypothetical protein AAVH_05835 [Aphelenchoides avenae]|nr:hypothetical protein AAVH_05835 [Aphelenchus avenae]